MDSRLLEEASEREAVSKPAFAVLAVALLCVAGAVGCHLSAEDLRLHDMDAHGYLTGRLWCVVAATVFSLGFAALVVQGWRSPSSGSRRKGRSSGSSSRSGRKRRRSRRSAAAADLAG
jgi:hypothetical protein